MGCTSSREVSDPRPAIPRQGVTISRPVDPPGAVPAPARNAQGVPRSYAKFDLSAQNINRALGYAAEYLHRKNQNVLVIAVGGAVNTLFLQTRGSTHDVDFFSREFSGNELELLRAAGRYAVERSSAPLGEDWLNNATQRMPGVVENIPQLIRVAREQNEIVFQAPGLTALAAPWNYAFVKKVGRISQGTGRAYDAGDAVAYLHRYIERNGGRPIPVQLIRQWGEIYRANVPDLILKELDQTYHRNYGQHGILFNGGSTQAGPSSKRPKR